MHVRSKSIVAFFGGTGFDYNNTKKGYVEPTELDGKKSAPRPKDDDSVALENDGTDESFTALTDMLGDGQLRFGYDGCHNRGGGMYAFGVKQPAQHLYAKVKKEFVDDVDLTEIKIVLTAHSRGSLSALLFAQQIAADPLLKDKVKIILDLRDPVPGNLMWAANMDVAKVTTMASKLYDFSQCESITSAHITIQEKGNLEVGFAVLVPKFSPSTRIELDCLPGFHFIQESYERSKKRIENKWKKLGINNGASANDATNDGCKIVSDKIYFLGLVKSLQIYLENGVAIDYRKVISSIKNIRSKLQNKYSSKIDTESVEDENLLLEELKILQVELYKCLNEDYNVIPRPPTVKTRQLHFGGKIEQRVFDAGSAFVNRRHAELHDAVLSEDHPINNKKILYDYVGPRADIGLDGKYDWLVSECNRYAKYLRDKGEEYLCQIKSIADLSKILEDKPVTKEKMLEKIKNFSTEFDKVKVRLSAPQSYWFIKGVLHVLASIGTLFIYTAVRASHSKATKGTAKFWQSHKNAFKNCTENVLNEIPLKK